MFVKGPSSSQKKTSLKMQLKDEKKEIRNWKMSHLSLKKKQSQQRLLFRDNNSSLPREMDPLIWDNLLFIVTSLHFILSRLTS